MNYRPNISPNVAIGRLLSAAKRFQSLKNRGDQIPDFDADVPPFELRRT